MLVSLDSFQSSPYIVFGEPKTIGGRVINKYVIDSFQDHTKEKAAEIMLQFLNANPPISPTFPVESERLMRVLSTNKYVIINGNAISLANVTEASATSPPKYRDRYFSETYMEEPVQCTKGHLFEKKRAIAWLNYSRNCPAGDHLMGDLELIEDLADEISEYVNAKQKEDGRLDELVQ